MATDTFVNILDLQPITEVVNGDYLIVETPAGTRIINFKDFILPNSNILIAQTVYDNTTAILSNFGLMNDYIAALSGAINTSGTSCTNSISSNNRSMQTQLTSVSTVLQNEIISLTTNLVDQISNINANIVTVSTNMVDISGNPYVGTATITIAAGAAIGIGSISPIATKPLSTNNISITPANAYAARNPAYISNFSANSVLTISSPFSGNGLAKEDAIYNILAVSQFYIAS